MIAGYQQHCIPLGSQLAVAMPGFISFTAAVSKFRGDATPLERVTSGGYRIIQTGAMIIQQRLLQLELVANCGDSMERLRVGS